MTTLEAAKIFGQIAGLLSLKEDNQFKIKAYDTALQNLQRFNEPLDSFLTRIDNKEVKGFGEQLRGHIKELIDFGKIELLENLKKEIPLEFQELLKIKGLSGKKIRLLNESLGIKNLNDLKNICTDGSILKVKGFAEKSVETLKASIIFFESFKDFIGHKKHEDILSELLSIKEIKLSPTGESLRKNEIYSKVEILIDSDDLNSVIEILTKKNYSLEEKNDSFIIFENLIDNFKLKIHLSSKENFNRDSFVLSADEMHFNFLKNSTMWNGKIEDFSSINDFYKSLLLPEIPAEMRDGILEEEYLDLLKNNSSEMLKPGFDISNVLIKESDLKGIIHNHSTYSDGIHSIEEMANAALKLGFQYIGISDHSKSAFYAGGLKEDSIKKQHEEIDILNEKLAPFKILKGIESDILKDGSLDYKDSVLESFDFIISSIHNRFNQNKTDMTKRICRAIENPYTTILGHVSGRLLLQRSEYEMDIEKILETASTNNKSIEFNSNPKRLDLSWRNLLKAQKANIKICISPDAHSTEQLKYFKYGVQFLRKAGLTPEKVLNTLGADQFLAYSSK